MQAAMAYAQLTRIDELIAQKRKIFSWYYELLSALEGIQINKPGNCVNASYWKVSVVWDERYSITKQHLASKLREKGIDTRPFFSPLSTIPAYAGLPKQPHLTPNALKLSNCGINLPSALKLEKDDVAFVCDQLCELFLAN